MEVEEEGREKPRSSLERRVSESVFITVRKMTTLSASPWYTPIFSGIDGVDQASVVTEADRPVYHDHSSLQNSW